MKTVIYTICKNEIKHVERFMAHTKEADYVYVADTGSTDGTQERLRSLGAIVFDINIVPWRFDHARNTILNLLPRDADWCLSVDLDEFLAARWRTHLENAVSEKSTRVSYLYTWNWTPDGKPHTQFITNKIHKRFNYIWTNPCHEVLEWTNAEIPEVIAKSKIEMEHHADNTKSRGQYLDLLILAAKEKPEDSRSAYYLGREFYFNKKYDEAIKMCEKHIKLPTSDWDQERAASMRIIAKCYQIKQNQKEAIGWYLKSCAESQGTREPWFALAEAYNQTRDTLGCYYAIKKCLDIKTRTYSYIANSQCWGSDVYDLAAISAWGLGNKEEAYDFAVTAHEMNPCDLRMKNNLKFISDSLNKGYIFK